MRVSIESGNLRVTTTRGFFLKDMSCSHEIVQTSLTRVFDTAGVARSRHSVGFPDSSPSGICEGLGRVLVVPSSLAEGRAKTRTPARDPSAEEFLGHSGRGTGVGGFRVFGASLRVRGSGGRRVDGVGAFLL